MSNDARLIDYYARRANEYDGIYRKPERQDDLRILTGLCAQIFAGQKVLEVACGTGHWTQIVSQVAKSVAATDINEEVLRIARAKNYGCEVRFEKAGAFDLEICSRNDFTAGLAAFWWSHLRKSGIKDFLLHFHRQFAPGTMMVFMDNRFVSGSNTPISRTDDEGNTYQWRKLEDGSGHEVLKNFPDENEVRSLIGNGVTEINWTGLRHYWLLTYRLK